MPSFFPGSPLKYSGHKIPDLEKLIVSHSPKYKEENINVILIEQRHGSKDTQWTYNVLMCFTLKPYFLILKNNTVKIL